MTQQKNKALRDSLGRRARTFTGADLAERVIAWLEDKDCGPNDPVRDLFKLAAQVWDVHAIINYIHTKEQKWNLHFRRSISLAPKGLKVEYLHQTDLPKTPANSNMLLAWNNAVILWSRGLLDRIRVCAREGCGKWFFARFSHTRYHEDACRLAVEVANPEYIQSRREYMREIRKKMKKGKTGGQS